MPPLASAVEPEQTAPRSSTSTRPYRRRARWYAVLAAMMPAPMTTASAATTMPAASHAEVVLLDQLVLAELARAAALELDAAVHDDVAAVRDLGGLVEVLLRHQHRELAPLLQLPDLADHPAHQDGGQAHRGLVDEEDARRGHERARHRQHLLLAAAHAAGQLPTPRGQHREGLEGEGQVGRDVGARARPVGAEQAATRP